MEGLSISDALAMKDNNNEFGGGGWVWIILIFLLLLGGGFNRNNGADEFIQRDIFSNQTATLTSSADNLKATLEAGYNNTIATMQGNYNTLLGFKDMQYQLAQNQFASQQCCCDLKSQIANSTNTIVTAMCNNTQSIKDMITQGRISELEYLLAQANTVISNNTQSQYLISQLKTTTTTG